MNVQSVKASLIRYEGSISFMYKCTGGKVTVGVGHAIEDAVSACNLKWTRDGAPAAGPQVQNDFSRVEAALKGAAAGTYAPLTSCRMAASDIDALLEDDIRRFEDSLRQKIQNWDGLPGPAQEALFDMGFNLGIGGLLEFQRLLAAVASGDWETAAAECHRKGIGDERNRLTAQLFRQSGASGASA